MYVPLFADIITAERWLMIMPMAVLSNFLIYCVVNAFTPGPGNILALNTVTNYGYKKGKPLFFGIFITCPCFISMISPLSFCFCSFTSFIQNHPPTDTWQKSH